MKFLITILVVSFNFSNEVLYKMNIDRMYVKCSVCSAVMFCTLEFLNNFVCYKSTTAYSVQIIKKMLIESFTITFILK